jgi:hypothetical protein
MVNKRTPLEHAGLPSIEKYSILRTPAGSNINIKNTNLREYLGVNSRERVDARAARVRAGKTTP